MAASPIILVKGTTPATPSAGKVALYVDTSGVPHYVDDTGTDSTLIGPTGPTGNSLTRPKASLSSSAGSAVIDLSTGTEVHEITLTENTTITFTNLPAAGYVAELRVRVIQHASAAKTCAFSGTSVKTAGGTWAASTTLSSVEDVGVAVDSSGNLTLYPSGLLT